MQWRTAQAALVMILLVGGMGLARGDESAAPASAGTGARPAAGRNDLETVAPPRGLPVEQERNPGHGPTPHEPVFLERATTTTEHTRFGPSAWIAPGAPFDRRENPGGPAIGFTITWPTRARGAPTAGPGPWQGSAAR